jgi:trehalose 6-phosphate phosphatase
MNIMNWERAMPLAERQIEIEQFIGKVAVAERSALLLDYDGTLAPFSIDRGEALPYPGVVPTLQEIMGSGRTRVVIVTGRSAPEVVPLLGIHPHPEVWGAHGLQHLRPDGTCETLPLDKEVLSALENARRWLKSEGFQNLAEEKPGGIAVHWRGLPKSRTVEVRDRVLRGWFPIAQDSLMSILEFDGGVEIRVPDLHKGDAIRIITQEMNRETPIAYLGDDATDEPAFDALGDRGLSVLVRPEWRKTSARLWLRPPEELLDFLTLWMAACYDRQAENRHRTLPQRDPL